MAQEIKIKKKVTIRKKGDEIVMKNFGKLKVELLWSSDTDHDLALFYRRKDGEVGGVFSSKFRKKLSDLGTLEAFPFIRHEGDNPAPSASGEANEVMYIAKLDDIDQAYICIINYTAALKESDFTFADQKAHVDITSDAAGEYYSVEADSSDNGHVYCVCTINNKDGVNTLKKSGLEIPEVMDLATAYDKIPAFSLICTVEGEED